MNGPLKFYWQTALKCPTLLVTWNTDASKLGTKVADYLNEKLDARSFCEIEPAGFFSLDGVAIEDKLIRFPESRFYACPEKNFVVFKSDPPSFGWYRFLNLILDVAEQYCRTKEVYAIGSMISMSAHTAPRELISTFNSSELKNSLSQYNLGGSSDFETPPGQRPTLNSFFLWAAKRRNIPAVTLWAPVPFYLATVGDPKAEKRGLGFLDQRLDLRLDLTHLDHEIAEQDQKIDRLRASHPDVDDYIRRLESNSMLSLEETQKLVQEVENFFLRGEI
jgi:proteasome assembly chaperone (PAC2) family protein